VESYRGIVGKVTTGSRDKAGSGYGKRGQTGDVDREIADYTAVIDMPDAPADQRAMARNNRGAAYGKRGQTGDVDREIADYTAVIDMPDAPADQRAWAKVSVESLRQPKKPKSE
jgi:hypothetical protein